MINEINKIKEEYNAVELQQRDRLIALFKLLEARQNYRRVAFSNGDVWSNCWQGGRPDLRQDAAIAHLVHTITQIDPGEPMPSKAPEVLPPPAAPLPAPQGAHTPPKRYRVVTQPRPKRN